MNAFPAFHGDELSAIGAAQMSATVGAKSVSHLEYITEEGVEAMAKADVTAIICPTTLYLLRLPSPPVRRMIENGVAIAIGLSKV